MTATNTCKNQPATSTNRESTGNAQICEKTG